MSPPPRASASVGGGGRGTRAEGAAKARRTAQPARHASRATRLVSRLRSPPPPPSSGTPPKCRPPKTAFDGGRDIDVPESVCASKSICHGRLGGLHAQRSVLPRIVDPRRRHLVGDGLDRVARGDRVLPRQLPAKLRHLTPQPCLQAKCPGRACFRLPHLWDLRLSTRRGCLRRLSRRRARLKVGRSEEEML